MQSAVKHWWGVGFKLPRDSLLLQNRGQEHPFSLFLVHPQAALLLISPSWRLSWVRSRRRWLRRKPTRICLLSSLPLPPHYLLLRNPHSLPCSLHVFTLFAPTVCTVFCAVWLTLVMSYFGFFSLYYCACLHYHLFVGDSDGQYHYRINTWVYHRLLSFLPFITQVVVIVNTQVYLVCSDHPFSMIPKWGR